MRRILQPLLLFFCLFSVFLASAQPNFPDAPVPLPAAGLWWFGAVLGGLGLWQRKSKHKGEVNP